MPGRHRGRGHHWRFMVSSSAVVSSCKGTAAFAAAGSIADVSGSLVFQAANRFHSILQQWCSHGTGSVKISVVPGWHNCCFSGQHQIHYLPAAAGSSAAGWTAACDVLHLVSVLALLPFAQHLCAGCAACGASSFSSGSNLCTCSRDSSSNSAQHLVLCFTAHRWWCSLSQI